MRAILFAVLFAGIGLLLMKLLETFIPELFSEDDEFDVSEKQDSSVIIEEDAVPDASVLNGSKLDITIDDDEPEEMQELDGADDSGSTDYESPAELVEEVEELDAAEPDESAAKEDAAPAATEGGNGELPDIGDFSDSFEAAEIAGNSEGLSSIDGGGGGSSAEILGGMHETQEIVKAVQTVLKKDQEG